MSATTVDEIAPGVRRIGLRHSNVFAVDDGDGVLLVDAGLRGEDTAILTGLREAGVDPHAVTAIVITHAHPDHYGSAAALHASIGAPVLVGAADADVVRGHAVMPPPVLPLDEREFYDTVNADVPAATPVTVERELHDGDRIGEDVTVVAVPGHTDGSIALRLGSRRVLLCGDLAVVRDGVLRPGIFNADTARARTSLARAATLPVDVVGCGHGPAIGSGGADHLRRALRPG